MEELNSIISAAEQYSNKGDFEKQIELCNKYLKRVLDTKSKNMTGYRAPLYAGLIDGYIKTEQYDRAGSMAKKALADKYMNEYANTFFYGCMCVALANRGESDEAKKYGKLYKKGIRFLLQHQDMVQNIPFLKNVFDESFFEMVDNSLYMDARPICPRRTLEEPIKLSISLMTSNRKDTIRKCLDSMKRLREVIPSELVIVDTGCDDEMRGIIEEYTDIIVKFEWCNDFAAARNAGLSRCTGNWLLFIDDDEWFDNTDAIEDFFLSGEYRNYHMAYYGVRNYADKEGTLYADNEVMRMCQLTKETHFRGRIHEQIQPYYEETKHLKSFVHHFGYAYESDEERIRHGYRNIIPMIEAVDEEPYDINMRIHLAHGYFNTKEYRSLERICDESIRQIGTPKSFQMLKYYSGFCGGYVWALSQMGFYDLTIRACDEFLKTNLTKMGQLTLYRWKAYAAYRMKLVEESLDAINHYESLMVEFEKNPESFYRERMHMTESATHEQEMVKALRAAVEHEEFVDSEVDALRRRNYEKMMQLEADGSDNRRLAILYYAESELCLQESFCKAQMGKEDENYSFYRLGLVDAIFTQCRYNVALEEIGLALKDKRMTGSDQIMLLCEGCIAAFRQKDYTLAHKYGILYQKAVTLYGEEVKKNSVFVVAALQEHNQEYIAEILEALVPKNEISENSVVQPQDEMAMLAKQIKIQARQLINAGDKSAARNILNQLLSMMPDDIEAKEMMEE